MSEPLWGPAETSEFLGVPVTTLYAWRVRGDGPQGFRVGRHVRYRPEDVRSWVDGQVMRSVEVNASAPFDLAADVAPWADVALELATCPCDSCPDDCGEPVEFVDHVEDPELAW